MKLKDYIIKTTQKLSSSAYDKQRPTQTIVVKCQCGYYARKPLKRKLGNPNPAKFKIVKFDNVFDHLVVEINYPDCKNYEGNKILVYKNLTIEKLLKQKTIDPHFSNNKNFHSPFARFVPTKQGWEQACKLAETLDV